MCGISGVLGRFPSRKDQEEALIKMTAPLQHRGPDEWGLYLAPEIGFGHTRLSIIDVADGHQPMHTGRSVIAFNGEIFNHCELRQEMESKGIAFETRSDTEVVLKLYELEGVAAFSRFDGQYAILIWDRREKTLLAARDRYGVRPLFCLRHDGRYYFSSEMKSFDGLPGVSRRYDPAQLLEHGLLWNTLGNGTVYEGITNVEPGCYEVYRPGSSPKQVRYYQVGCMMGEHEAPRSLGETAEHFTALLQDSVDLRLRADVRVGAYLSGGIDSSVIAYLTNSRREDDFRAFSVQFDDPEYDEGRYQRMVADQIDSPLDSVMISSAMIEDNFMDAVYHTEGPMFRTAPIPLYLLSEKVRASGVKVVLTGEGADEILYGYDVFKELKILEQWKREGDGTTAPELLKQLYPHLKHYADPARFGMMRMYYERHLEDFENDLCGLNIRVGNNQILANFLNKDFGVSYDKGALLEKLRLYLPEEFSSWSLLRKNSFLELKTLLPGYLLSSQGDRMSLAHGVEGRYPFLDHRVVEATFSYPDEYKLNGFSQKHLLRHAFEGKIPDEVINRPKRPYMAPDLKAFFRDGKLTETVRYFLSAEVLREYGIFEPKRVAMYLRKFADGLPDEVGYRDNMIMIFLLSAQIAQHWARSPKQPQLAESLQRVRLTDW